MKKANQYKWLLIVEGSTDVKTYRNLLGEYGVHIDDFKIVTPRSKNHVCNAKTWENIQIPSMLSKISLYELVVQDIGRSDFRGIILIIDSDTDSTDPFNNYSRNSKLSYFETTVPKNKNLGSYWHLDDLSGINRIPIYGINVPFQSTGCLETDLLEAYGFPLEGQLEYVNIVTAIQKTSTHWNIPKHGDGKDWWEKNTKAKMDKFIYSAFSEGFKISGEKPTLSHEPKVIQNIKAALGIA